MDTTIPTPTSRPAPHATAAHPPSAAERAYRHVKAAILDRTLGSGELITEGAVAQEVGVSRTPVREAFLRLQAEGLLRLFPKKGALVSPPSSRDVEDLLEARELVEAWAAGKATAQPDPALVETLAALLDRMAEARDAGDPASLMAADRNFHEALVAAGGNAVLERLYASLRDRQLLMGVAAMRVSPARMAEAVTQHAALLDAVRAGDADQLRALAHAHVRTAAGYLRADR